MFNNSFMQQALKQAEYAFVMDEVPVGVVVVQGQQIISAAFNQTISGTDPTAHAEILALRQAAKYLGSIYLNECSLYTTLEPCAMCAQAISLARIKRLYFSSDDPKSGSIENGVRIFSSKNCHHVPEVYGGFYASQSRDLLQRFFRAKR